MQIKGSVKRSPDFCTHFLLSNHIPLSECFFQITVQKQKFIFVPDHLTQEYLLFVVLFVRFECVEFFHRPLMNMQ